MLSSPNKKDLIEKLPDLDNFLVSCDVCLFLHDHRLAGNRIVNAPPLTGQDYHVPAIVAERDKLPGGYGML